MKEIKMKGKRQFPTKDKLLLIIWLWALKVCKEILSGLLAGSRSIWFRV